MIPVLNKKQLEMLDAAYPEKCADPADRDRDVWIKVGERNVIRRLIHEYRTAKSQSQ
jgi:hypothetical protein